MKLVSVSPLRKCDKKAAKLLERILNSPKYETMIRKEIEKRYKKFFDKIIYGGICED